MDAETGNRWERKCAESREAGAVTEESGSTELEPPHDSRLGEEEEWEKGVKILTERELWEKVSRPRENWKAGTVGRETDTGLLKEGGWSQTRRREEILFVPRLPTADHLLGDIDSRTLSERRWYENIFLFPKCMLITHLSVFSLSSVFLSSTSFFIPLCAHWGVTNRWFGGLKEAQMEKQMERVIGHVYAFYLRFPPPFISLAYSLPLSFVPPFSCL